MMKFHDTQFNLGHEVEMHKLPIICNKYSYLNYLEDVNVGYILLNSDYIVLSHNKIIQNCLENDRMMRICSVNSFDYSYLCQTLNECKTISMDEGIASFQNSFTLGPVSIERKIDDLFEEFISHVIEIDELFKQDLVHFLDSNCILKSDSNYVSSHKMRSKNLKIKLSELIKNIKYKLTGENFFKLAVTKIPFRNKHTYLELKFRMIRLDDKEILYEIITQDVTNIYEAQILKNQMNYKSLGLAKVAHDFKNPILSLISLLPTDSGTGTDSYVSSCYEDPESVSYPNPTIMLKRSKTIRDFTRDLNPIPFDTNTMIKSFSNYILMLIEDFNVYAKMDVEKIFHTASPAIDVPDVEEIEVRPILEFSVNIFKIRQINEKDKQKINMILIIEDNVPEKILANETKLKQVLINILSNSYKFTLAGEILIKATVYFGDDHTKYLRITIQDTGVGIEKKDQSKLFSPFKMIDSTMKLNSHGSGLGLIIIKEILNKMNSEIHLKSEPGVGTTFWFDLPIQSANNQLCQNASSDRIESISFIDQNMFTESSANIYHQLNNCENNNICVNNEFRPEKDRKKLDMNAHPLEFSNFNTLRNTNNNDKIIIKSARLSRSKLLSNRDENNEILKIEELLTARKQPVTDKGNKCKKMLRFLICDDEEFIKIALQKLIVTVCQDRLITYDISLAQNGIECLYIMNLKLFKNEPIDVLFIDDQMSIMNGGMTVKIIKELIEENKFPKLLKYVVTSNSDSKKHIEFLKNGCDEVVSKPITKSKIQQIISGLIKR